MVELNKTKIIATIGPRTKSKEVLKELILKGADVLRINSAHSNDEEIIEISNKLKDLNEELGTYVSLLIDTFGDKQRLKTDGSTYDLQNNSILIINHSVISPGEITIPLNVFSNIKIGDTILLDNGKILLEALFKAGDKITTKVISGGILHNNTGFKLKGYSLCSNDLSVSDKNLIKVINYTKTKYIGLSFASERKDIENFRKCLNKDTKIIAKIENKEGLKNIDNFIDIIDGIMIARGDLASEVSFINLPIIQKKLIEKAKLNNKIVIVATEALKSMENNKYPTRAELTDVVNSVFDGADALMLSEETSVGKYPIDVINFMRKLALTAEENHDYMKKVNINKTKLSDYLVQLSYDASFFNDIKLILCNDPLIIKALSNLRPDKYICTFVKDKKEAENYNLLYAVIPIVSYPNKEELIKTFKLKQGDLYLVINDSSVATYKL